MNDMEHFTEAELAHHLAACMLKGTNHQLRHLQITVLEGRLNVTGRVNSFYTKQLALHAAMKCLGSRIGAAQFLIVVTDSKIPSEALRSLPASCEQQLECASA